MVYVQNQKAPEIISINGATIEFFYKSGTLKSVRVSKPSGAIGAPIDAIYDEIEMHCSSNAMFIAEPVRFKGGVYILEWKVIYE